MPLTIEDRKAVRDCFKRYAKDRGVDTLSDKYFDFLLMINIVSDENPQGRQQYSYVETVSELLEDPGGDIGAFKILDMWYLGIEEEPLAGLIVIQLLGELSLERIRELAHDDKAKCAAFGGLNGLRSLQPDMRERCVKTITEFCNRNAGIMIETAEKNGLAANNQWVMVFVKNVCGNQELMKNVVMYGGVAILATCFCVETVRAIKQWYIGEMSGSRAATVVGGAALGALSTAAGQSLGATMGTVCGGPIGCVIGSLVGAVVGGIGGRSLANQLGSTFFNLPKDVAVENAYITLDVPLNASVGEINSAYRALALLHHPDRPGGNAVHFKKVCLAVELIRLHVRDA
mmetsp:Transcript_7129/g.18549  ORF Transcript_7129/g.18549 Transcript_7129/m.18549 type:complete len:345 (-) Transcript_7129:935-1969(-)|eukprot:CAMPEP_0184714594 /NCGR_PEP_ID=MMETSP0314-20130426/4689_1 /TAXON_ID=38298 /ORGANISM="Rhodella maculata, Strain CCMP 736" /LENGTH=344 /DNA_ID=CAMNT_0027177543 /DNA_START=162 /DNA_END=1196 /DNA_ORIENTATION=-